MEGNNQAAPNDIEIQLEPLETSMIEELDSLPSLSSSCCIYRVPERLRCVNEKAYTPQVVSIGPLHHGNKALKVMEEHKKRYLKDFLRRTQASLKDCIKKIRDQEVRLRNCYAETIELSSDEFVRIILVDAAFIIEFILKYSFPVLRGENDRIFNKPWIRADVWRDMLLLENQLPFFILQDLFNRITASDSSSIERLSIINLSLHFIKEELTQIVGVEEYNFERIRSSQVEAQHFVDFLRLICQPPDDGRRLETDTSSSAPSMTKLHQAGVKFKVGSTQSTFDIRFTDGILEIPKLLIADETEFIFRNLVALEECHYLLGVGNNFVSDYVIILDDFVNSPKDVELLVEHGILENMLGDSSEVSTLINNLGIGVFSVGPNNFYYASLREELNKYCDSTWHKWMANLRQNYFNTPWATTSVIAAVVLLILTLIQTICSIISAIKGA